MSNRITGGIKFFDQNFGLFRAGVTAVASSNTDSVNYLLDVSRYTQWESIGSNDATSETITITFPNSKTIDSLFLVDMNLKEFGIKYYDGLSFVDFTDVCGVNGVETVSISETDYSLPTAFYQFSEVSTTQIQITMTKTQEVDVDKFIGQFVATLEIGTFLGFPRVVPESTRNETTATALSRRLVVQKTYETNKIKINFKSHPFQNDEDIVETLFDREIPFLVYPCGGRTGSSYFRIEQKNWRINDIYNVQILGALKNEYEKGVYTLGFKKSITLQEHI